MNTQPHPHSQANTPMHEGTVGNGAGLNPATATPEQCTKVLRLLLSSTYPAQAKQYIDSFSVAKSEDSKFVTIRYAHPTDKQGSSEVNRRFNELTAAFRKSEHNYYDDLQSGSYRTLIGDTWLTQEDFAKALNSYAQKCGKLSEIAAIQNSGTFIG